MLATISTPTADRFNYRAPRHAQPAAELLTLLEAAQQAGCHVNTLRYAIKTGRLAAMTVGNAYVITREALDRFLANRQSSRVL